MEKLKPLQVERSDKTPFSSHVEFQKWADQVSPLLSFDSNLKSSFDKYVQIASVNHGLYGEKYSYEGLNLAIGILNQAIGLLEIMPIQNPTTNPPANITNSKNPPDGISLRHFAFAVGVVIFAAITIVVINHYFGLRL